MNTCLNPSRTVNSNTESKETSNPQNHLKKFKTFNRKLNARAEAETIPLKRKAPNPAVSCPPVQKKINDWSVSSLTPYFYSKTNPPETIIPWSAHFECIYQSLYQQKHLEVEAQLNALCDVQIKSLFIVTPPIEFHRKRYITDSLLELAATSDKAGSIFFQVLFDRLSPEQIRHALLESFDNNGKLLNLVCCVMDEPLFNKLEDKLDRQTLLEMVTQPINDLAPPLAFACRYNKSTYLFDTVIDEKKQLIKKLLKGGPGIDQTLLQFMCNDLRYPHNDIPLTYQEYHDRIKHLLHALNKQDRLDAVVFKGKSNESALLWACAGKECSSADLVFTLTESFNDKHKVDLLTAQAKTGNSLIQKCIELKKVDNVATLCQTLHKPLLRFKVLSICTLAGHSFFQQWLLDHCEKDIDHMLRNVDKKHRDLLIAGERHIWNQTTDCTDDILQQEQTPIVDAMNRGDMSLAQLLWNLIADPELQIKLLLYKTKHQTTLLQYMLDDREQWQFFKNKLKKSHNLILHNSFAAELHVHALAAERFDDADYYFSQIDSKLKYDLSNENYRLHLLNVCTERETISESFFNGLTPYQCTESVVYVLEHSLYDKKNLMANFLQLITLQENAGHKDTFIEWATSPRQGKQCPLTAALSLSVKTYRKLNDPEHELNWEFLKREARFNMQIIKAMASMMSEEQKKSFFFSLKDECYETLSLLGYKDILETIVDILGDSGSVFLKQINPATGGNFFHILFASRFVDYNFEYRELNDLTNTVDWLFENHELTSFLQDRLENDGSTPLHVLLATVKQSKITKSYISPMLQNHILKKLGQLYADSPQLVELLKLKDKNGCTPLHKFFSCKVTNKKIGDLLIQELGRGTFFELMHIKDKQGNTVMDHCSKLHKNLHQQYKDLFQTLPAEVK